jgi:alpha-tubulin suppressor-like RCC1 family protein
MDVGVDATIDAGAGIDAGVQATTDAAAVGDGAADAAADAQPDAPPPCLIEGGSPYIMDAVDLSATADGQGNACVVRQSGSVVCWGYRTSPANVSFPDDAGAVSVVQIAVTYGDACALDTTGAVWCWGQNGAGELGNGAPADADNHPVPSRVVNGARTPITATALAAAADSFCALLSSGQVLCWGNGYNSELAPALPDAGSYTNVAIPMPGITLPSGSLATGGDGYASCAWAGSVTACWGNAVNGQTLSSTVPSTSVAATLAEAGAAMPLRSMSVGLLHACALDNDSQVYCWGIDSDGARGTLSPGPAPNLVSGLADAGTTFVSASLYATCVVDSAQHARCFGSNESAQLGVGDASAFTTPDPMLVVDLDGGGALFPVSRVSATCAILAGSCGPTGPGQVVCWGFLDANPAGDSDPTPHPIASP